MPRTDPFHRLRAATVAVLCAGAGFGVPGCAKDEEPGVDGAAPAAPRPGDARASRAAVEKDTGDRLCAAVFGPSGDK